MSESNEELIRELWDEVFKEMEELLDKQEELERWRARVALFMKRITNQSVCSGCGAPVYFLRHLNGNIGIYDADATDHHATCPRAKDFRRRGAKTPVRPEQVSGSPQAKEV